MNLSYPALYLATVSWILVTLPFILLLSLCRPVLSFVSISLYCNSYLVTVVTVTNFHVFVTVLFVTLSYPSHLPSHTSKYVIIHHYSPFFLRFLYHNVFFYFSCMSLLHIYCYSVTPSYLSLLCHSFISIVTLSHMYFVTQSILCTSYLNLFYQISFILKWSSSG